VAVVSLPKIIRNKYEIFHGGLSGVNNTGTTIMDTAKILFVGNSPKRFEAIPCTRTVMPIQYWFSFIAVRWLLSKTPRISPSSNLRNNT
jgi:hypothetical protein